jgi:tRNA A64-2'-O-ribosylphosphate transferase
VESLRKHGKSVYFKSTDGHYGQWDFSLKRMNLHILPTIKEHKGVLFVDTTRRGKQFPDSLSKTIPIWCTVLNQYVSNTMNYGWDVPFQSTPSAVPQSEIHQISEIIPALVQKLIESDADKESILRNIVKPLRCIWIHPGSRMFLDCQDSHWSYDELDQLNFFPIICVSASISTSEEHTPIFPPSGDFDYVQGAADDSESWAPGFTAEHFWTICEKIDENTSTTELQIMVQELLSRSIQIQPATDVKDYDWIADTLIAIGSARAAGRPNCWNFFDVIVNCGVSSFGTAQSQHYLYLDIPEGKKGQNELFRSITPFLNWIAPFIMQKKRILIHCMQGRDRSVGIAIALFQRFGKQPNPEIPPMGNQY